MGNKQIIRLNESQLKSIIMEATKKVIKEYRNRIEPRHGYLWVNGRDFLEESLGFDGQDLMDAVGADENLSEIFKNEFKVTCEASYYPETRYTPEENNFEIIDDRGLMNLIEDVQDEEFRQLLYEGYEKYVESAEFRFNEDDREPEDYDYDNLDESTDELTAKFLTRAQNMASVKGRQEQANYFRHGARDAAEEEIGGKDEAIRSVHPYKIVYMSSMGCEVNLQNYGTATVHTPYGPIKTFNADTLMTEMPRYMKVSDKATARKIAKWWQLYGEKPELRRLGDWHELYVW